MLCRMPDQFMAALRETGYNAHRRCRSMIESGDSQALRVAQVAHRLQVHPRTVYTLIRQGHLPGIKVGRAWRVLPESLEAYLHGSEVVANPDSVVEVVGPEERA